MLGLGSDVTSGSSPLTRGKPRQIVENDDVSRLIPAHAGKTRGSSGRSGQPGAHPRSRGENVAAELRLRVAKGSSPLTRGKQVSHVHEHGRRRLIPAHAGKTHGHLVLHFRHAAHPRSRGENHWFGEPVLLQTGSSPLTRGKLMPLGLITTDGGLIPAHAGKTSPCRASPGRSPAHPRSRGENPGRLLIHETAVGSSPLTRGKPLVSERLKLGKGLIPAHAGKTGCKP